MKRNQKTTLRLTGQDGDIRSLFFDILLTARPDYMILRVPGGLGTRMDAPYSERMLEHLERTILSVDVELQLVYARPESPSERLLREEDVESLAESHGFHLIDF